MKTSQVLKVFFSATVVTVSLLSGTAVAQGCLYQKYQSDTYGFSEPFSNSDGFTQTSFLESREMTMGSAAMIAGLFGLSWLLRQLKADKTPTEAAEETPAPEPEEPPELAAAPEENHPEAPGGELDIEPENETQAEEVEAETTEETEAQATEEEEEKEVAVAAQ